MTANGLAETLSSDFESMFSLLQSWDTDADGVVSATDFRLGLQVSAVCIEWGGGPMGCAAVGRRTRCGNCGRIYRHGWCPSHRPIRETGTTAGRVASRAEAQGAAPRGGHARLYEDGGGCDVPSCRARSLRVSGSPWRT